jgi:hypothetical protein
VVNPAIAALEGKTEPDERSRGMLKSIRAEYRGTLILAGGLRPMKHSNMPFDIHGC